MKWLKAFGVTAAAALCGLALSACGQKPAEKAEAPAAAKTDYTIGWTIYAGWMPWPYAEQTGIVKKWSDKYGVNIKFVQINDYVESLNQFTAGKIDGVTSTNMDALTIPAAAGKDSTFVVVGDYSNGNDGLVLKNGSSLADLKGRTVNLVELSVSHYFLARAVETAGLKMSDIRTVNTSDADIVAAFGAPETQAVAAWNPQLSEIKKMAGATEVFDSSKIPNEILDVMNVSTEVLKANPDLGKALAGIWYETMEILHKGDAQSKAAVEQMAKGAGTTPESLGEQLETTYFYVNARDAANYMESPDLITVTNRVRQFSYSKGLFGSAAKSVDAIGIEFPGGKVLGDKGQIRLRFDPTYMKLAATGF